MSWRCSSTQLTTPFGQQDFCCQNALEARRGAEGIGPGDACLFSGRRLVNVAETSNRVYKDIQRAGVDADVVPTCSGASFILATFYAVD